MPSPHLTLTRERIPALVAERCFGPAAPSAPGGDDNRVGIELEWLTYHRGNGTARPDLAVLEASVRSAGALAGGPAVTFEPGGQLEIGTCPAPGVDAACASAVSTSLALQEPLRDAGIELVAVGLDPVRAPHRITTAPRYVAMEAYFDQFGPAGREMMCGTAAIQINVDLESARSGASAGRWHVAHAVGPVLVAAFANSPFARGRPTGYRSTRMAVWAALDPLRTAPVGLGDPHRLPVDVWIDYALAAPVMLVREGDDTYRPRLRPRPFAEWLEGDEEDGFPTEEDLLYHLTTLFPPVRPRGWLELRMIDALPAPWWRAAVAVTTALVTDEAAAATALEACAGSAGWWTPAARHGLSQPAIAAAARRCFAAALDALPRVGAGAVTEAVCAAYTDLYVERARCPADDLLEAWARNGVVPAMGHATDGARGGRSPAEVPSWT